MDPKTELCCSPLGGQPAATPTRRLTFMDLPRRVRERIYRLVFASDECDEWRGYRLDEPEPPYHPAAAAIGLLCASRTIYEEASALLYETVSLGSSPAHVLSYLEFLGPRRLRQIRILQVYFHCLGDCHLKSRASPTELDWDPVWDFLWTSWVCVRRVEVDVSYSYWRVRDYPSGGDDLRCELTRPEQTDRLWYGLRCFSMAREIDIDYRVPEYYVYHLARDLGWQLHGTAQVDYMLGLSWFRGKLVNPDFPRQFNWILDVHAKLDDEPDAPNRITDAGDWDDDCTSVEAAGDLDDVVVHAAVAAAAAAAATANATTAATAASADEAETDEEDEEDEDDDDEDAQTVDDDGDDDAVAAPTTTVDVFKGPGPAETFRLLDLPPEIRLKIYDLASDWVERPYWPQAPRRWSTGVDLLYACRRMAEEAPSSVYRCVRLYDASAVDVLTRLGPRLAHVRRLEACFRCLCPWGAPSFTNQFDFSRHIVPCADEHAAWSDAFALIRARRQRIPHVSVTFASCCRYRSAWDGETWGLPGDRAESRCGDLEAHFVGLLVAATEARLAETLTLAGDVPPSLAARLAHHPAATGQLSLRFISGAMHDFVRCTESARKTWELMMPASLPAAEWPNPESYPCTPFAGQAPLTHFVLVNEQSAGPRWDRLVGTPDVGDAGGCDGVGEEGRAGDSGKDDVGAQDGTDRHEVLEGDPVDAGDDGGEAGDGDGAGDGGGQAVGNVDAGEGLEEDEAEVEVDAGMRRVTDWPFERGWEDLRAVMDYGNNPKVVKGRNDPYIWGP